MEWTAAGAFSLRRVRTELAMAWAKSKDSSSFSESYGVTKVMASN